ncbi:MAG: hypothetical protein OQL20_01660 [Sedimenticola sp.]|nr:hypothetical protein [Sedimenticola sp.]
MDNYLAIIPNAIDPYGYETVPILAYPEGFKYRFRYDEEWVENTLLHQTDIINKPGYIILRDFENAVLYPIRFFKVVDFNKIGKIFYIEVKLGSLVSYDSETRHRQNQINDFNTKFTTFHDTLITNNEPNKNMSPLMFLTNFQVTISNGHKNSKLDEDMQDWGNTLACFKDISFFSGVQFLRLISTTPLDSKRGKVDQHNGQLILQEGADYKLQVAQIIPNSPKKLPPQSDITVNTDNQSICTLLDAQRAVGKYDILTFLIRVNDNRRSTVSFIDLRYNPNPAIHGQGEPRLYIPVEISASRKNTTRNSLFLIFFCILYLVPSSTTLIPSSWLTIYAEFVQDISIIGVTISLFSLTSELSRILKK